MSYETNIEAVTLPAAADLSSSQHRLLQVDTNGKAALATATSMVVGILQNKPASGQAASLAYSGVSKVLAGAAFAAGARITSDANGAAIAATTAGDSVIGVALQAAAASGDKVALIINTAPFAALA
jgi:hypothetical protein